MNDTLGEKLKEITGIIFNNWYTLKIALDHGQGGSPIVQNSKLENVLNTITSMMLSMSPNGDCSDISDYLEDIMDDEFDIILEDGSQTYVAKEINYIYNLLQAGNDVEVKNKVDSFPVKTSILTYTFNKAVSKQVEEELSDKDDEGNNSNENKMEVGEPDSEWTVVKHKRK